jgi:hypothetical protein
MRKRSHEKLRIFFCFCETDFTGPEPERLTTPLSVSVSGHNLKIQGDQKVSVHLMIKIQKVTSYVQSAPRQSPDIH